MKNWFYNSNIQFHLWDVTHLLTIGIILGLIVCVYLFRKKLIPIRGPIRIMTGLLLILSRLSLDVWYITTNQWSAQSSLPFELCSIASLLAGIMLLTKNRFLFEVLYFIALSGAAMAIATPDLYFGFPQYRYIQFFFDHFLLILAPLLMIWLYHYKITWRSVLTSFLFLNGLAAMVYIVNHLISANYMFLSEKPGGMSLLDVLGPYSYYLLSLEVIAFVLFSLLYLPFLIIKLKNK